MIRNPLLWSLVFFEHVELIYMKNFIHVITLQSDSKTLKTSCLFMMLHMKWTLFVGNSDSKTLKTSCLFMMLHMKWTLFVGNS